MHFLRQLRAVLWSFVGVRRRADVDRDLEGTRPHTLLIAAFAVGAFLVAGILTLVHFIADGRVGRAPTVASVPEPPTAATSTIPRHTGPVTVADTMEERTRPCTVCHGSATQSTRDGFSPRIAGKPARYLENQLRSFRDGRRTYAPMVYMVQYMSDDYLADIATYFSGVQLPYPPPEAVALTAEAEARARQLVEHGDDARGVPACVECHGSSLTGAAPAIPGLLGLPRHYMAAQFGAWRTGRLRSIAPDCMAEVARRLTPEDVPTIAAWLASQPVPPGMHAEAPTQRRLPLECGSVKAGTR